MRGHLRLLQLIESRGGLLDLRDKQGRRPLEIAEANRQTAVANYLKSEMYLNSVQVGFLSPPVQLHGGLLCIALGPSVCRDKKSD